MKIRREIDGLELLPGDVEDNRQPLVSSKTFEPYPGPTLPHEYADYVHPPVGLREVPVDPWAAPIR